MHRFTRDEAAIIETFLGAFIGFACGRLLSAYFRYLNRDRDRK